MLPDVKGYGHAISFGNNGELFIDQTTEFKDGYYVKTSRSGNLKPSDVAKFAKKYFIDSVVNFLPSGKADLSVDWEHYRKSLCENQQEKNKRNSSVRTVDVFGIFSTSVRKFIFREVDGEDAKNVQDQLNQDIPSDEKWSTSIKEAIELTQLPEAKGKASWKVIGCIAYYYLPIGQEIEASLGTRSMNVKATTKPLIFAYPILPDVKSEKIRSSVNLLKKYSGTSIDVASVDIHPIEIIEPSTIRSVP